MTDMNNDIPNNNQPPQVESKELPPQNVESQPPVPPTPSKTEMCQLIYYDFSIKQVIFV